MRDMKKEAAYLVGDTAYLYLKETESGFSYTAFQADHDQKIAEGVIDRSALDNPNRDAMTQARTLAIEECGLPRGPAAEVSVNMLVQFGGSEIRYRSHFEPETLPDDDIRFITSDYRELFRIPNGGTITVDYPDRHFSAKCNYLDETHTEINGEIYHICQFAEMLERNGGSCRPESEILHDEAAWRLGTQSFLTIRSEDKGWGYTLYDRSFHEKESGVLERPDLSVREARDAVMDRLGMENRSRTSIGYDFVKEKAAERNRPSVRETLKNAKQTEHVPKPVGRQEEMSL